MNKSRLVSAMRSFYIGFISFALLAALFSYYLFIYVAKQEKEIKAHRFRVLQNIELQLGNRITDLAQLSQSKMQQALLSGTFKTGIPVLPEEGIFIDSSQDHPLLLDTLYETVKNLPGTNWDIGLQNGRHVFRFYVVYNSSKGGAASKCCARICTPVDLMVSQVLYKDAFPSFLLLDREHVLYSNSREISDVLVPDSLTATPGKVIGNSIK